MIKTLTKIQKAIEIIKGKNLKKQGKNTFSKYDYYTPEQVSELVIGATHEVKLLTKFDLIRNDLGITGRLSIFDIESTEQPIVYEMASAIPDIKATNISQQLGGAMTYTKRYLLMNAFDIADNNLDFDTTENTQTTAKKTEPIENKEPEKVWLNKWRDKEKTTVLPFYTKIVLNARDKSMTSEDLKKYYKISTEVEKELKKDLE